jgi:hypothetical protein
MTCRYATPAESCWGVIRKRAAIEGPDAVLSFWTCEGHAGCLSLGGSYRHEPVRSARLPSCEFFEGVRPCWGSVAIYAVRRATDGGKTEHYACEGHVNTPKARGEYTPPPVAHRPLGPEDGAWPF